MHATGIALSIMLTLTSTCLAAPADKNTASSTEAHLSLGQVPFPYPHPYPPPFLPLHKRQNVDNTCGNQDGKDIKCDASSPGGGACCSVWGFCGNGPLYCGEGCQSQFGDCDLQTASIPHKHCGPKHDNQKCGLGECCSSHGKCGHSKKHCGKHCQPEFGMCYGEDDQTPQKPQQRPERCGRQFGNTTCAAGDCCSDAGWCGEGRLFCSVPQNCQRGFGRCDSDDAPKGLDLSPSVQPRKLIGNVTYGEAINRCSEPGTAALTFDDSPGNYTNAILDVLLKYGAKATFFVAGNTNGKGRIDENKIWIDAVKRIILEGHQIGSHTWSHPHLNNMSRNARIVDMVRNDRAIANVIGKYPTYMRAPYLECSKESGCIKDMIELGYHVVAGDVDTHDWEEKTTLEQMKANIDQAMKDRTVNDSMLVIQHDTNEDAVEVVEYILESIKEKKWKAVTVGACLNDTVDYWYREPAWVDLSSVARHGDDYGCVVSAPDFCGSVHPFSSTHKCRRSLKKCMAKHVECVVRVGSANTACVQYGQICAQLMTFCDECKAERRKECNSEDFSINRDDN